VSLKLKCGYKAALVFIAGSSVKTAGSSVKTAETNRFAH